MATFTSPQLIKSAGNIPVSINDSIILPHINNAMILIQQAITPELYSIYLTYNSTGALIADQIIYNDIQTAETFLALSFFISSLNLQLAGENGGILKGKGWDMTRIDFYSHTDIKILAADYKSRAVEIIKKYISVTTEYNESTGSLTHNKFSLLSL